MAAIDADPAGATLWRVGRYPDPLAWTDWSFVGSGRFDDPLGRFRTLYLAEQRLTCFLETLARFRPSVQALAAVAAMNDGDEGDDTPAIVRAMAGGGPPTLGRIAADWLATRRIGWLEPIAGLRALDLRAIETREALRVELAPFLAAHGYQDFDMAHALSQDRRLTQHVARWVYDRNYRAIVYPSRFGAQYDCWVVFGGSTPAEPPPFTPLGTARIQPDDPDLLQAVRTFNLRF